MAAEFGLLRVIWVFSSFILVPLGGFLSVKANLTIKVVGCILCGLGGAGLLQYLKMAGLVGTGLEVLAVLIIGGIILYSMAIHQPRGRS